MDVYTNTSAPTINAVERQLKLDFMNSIGTMAQGYAVAKQSGVDIDKVLPMNENLREMAAEYNLSPVEKDSSEDVKKAKMDLLRELQEAQWQITGTENIAPQGEENMGEQPATEWDKIRQQVNQGSQGMLVPNLTPNMW